MRTNPGTEPALDRTYNFGFEKLYADMVRIFGGRDAMVFPERAQWKAQNERIVAKVRKIVLPFSEERPFNTRYYRALRCMNGNIVCETMPGNSLVFEIDSKGRLIQGTGIPHEVIQHFEKTV